MKLLDDVDRQQGPDLLLHDLICKKRHTDEMKPRQTLVHAESQKNRFTHLTHTLHSFQLWH